MRPPKYKKHKPILCTVTAQCALVLLLLDTGMRIGAAAKMKSEHVDLKARRIKNVIGKGNKVTNFIISHRAAELLGVHLEANKITSGRVFPVNRVTMWRWVRDLGEEAGITDMHPHLLRHTFAIQMLEKTHDIRLVSQLLGHTNLNTTAIYTERSEDDLELAIDNLTTTAKSGG
jgi:site-specific recombinase XerD